MLTLSNLKSSQGKTKPKRRGRGSASHGDYSGRGIKGQKARSGVTGLKRRGVKNWLMKVPKQKGFVSPHPAKANVTLAQLDKHFAAGSEVTPFKLVKAGLIDSHKPGVKVLGGGKLTKKLIVKAHGFSASAKQAIEAKGGRAELIGKDAAKAAKDDKVEKK